MNPRSSFYRIWKRIEAMPWLVISLAIHIVAFVMMMNIQAGKARVEEEDIVIETQILKDEERVIDPEIIQEIFEKEVMETDVKKTSMEASSVEATMPNESIVPSEEQQIGDLVDEDELDGGMIHEAVQGLEQIALGSARLMMVSGDKETPGKSRNLGAFGLRKAPGGVKKEAVRKYGGSDVTENAVLAALAYLAKVQDKDGHWSSDPAEGPVGPNDVAVTGLCVLAYLGAGHTEAAGKYRSNVRSALDYLKRNQGPNGSWMAGGRMYGHGIVTMAMSEAYGMAGSKSMGADCAQRGVNFIVKTQGDTGGFHYTGPGMDMSVTGWQIMACKSAKVAGLKVPPETIEKFEKYLDAMGDPATGYTGYGSRGGGTPAMWAAGLVCRLFLGQNPDTDFLKKAAEAIGTTGPTLSNEYYVYYGTLGMFQVGGKKWKEWNDKFAMPVVTLQEKKGKYAGSWPLKGSTFGNHGAGRNYVTAMYTLSLEVYYRYLPVYRD